ncbi:MAG: sugar phosphate nucleotidyltransferase [bacterium]|nr:sugar phosphate nucleotidyltransferase [bacterium]
MQAIILAAGESSRFWPLNQKHKSQIRILGKPLIYWTIKGLEENGVKDIAVVTSPQSSIEEDLKIAVRDLNVNLTFFVQEKPLGTGNAIFQAKDFIREPFFIAWASEISIKNIAGEILNKYQQVKPQMVLVGVETSTPWEYGIFKMEDGRVVEIVENPDPGKEPSKIKTVGIYLLEPDFFNYYQNLAKHHEADFVDALNVCLKEKKAEFVFCQKDTLSLKYPWHILSISKTMLEAESFKNYIAPSATIGENVVIKGKVYIGENCRIGDNNVLRGPVNLENNVKTGAFFEIKNSVVQEGTHFHSGYVGDSVIGKNCRFGAGFIVANRRIDRENIKSVVRGKKIDTGLDYLGITVGNNTNVGISVSTMPGILIGPDCIVGPNSLVRENIEDSCVFYSKFEGVSKKVNCGKKS